MVLFKVFRLVRPALIKWAFLAAAITILLLVISGKTYDSPISLLPSTDTSATCTPRHSIFFLKTHKCASSTVQNILMRYGEKNALDFVLGDGGNYLGSPGLFNRKMIGATLWPQSGLFHIFCHHTRLNISEMRGVLYPDAVWVTILRDPVSLFESAFEYYQMQFSWKMDIHQFAALPIDLKRKLPRLGNGRIGGNQMAFDLGFDPEKLLANPGLLQQMIDTVQENFNLVMISELMDESLVLLQRIMCWTTDDVIYMTRNARRDEFKTKLSAQETRQLREFLAVDQQLYDHFLKRLAVFIQAGSPDTVVPQAEKLVMQRLRVQTRCLAGEVEDQSQLPQSQREFSRHVHVYRVSDPTDWTCSRINMPELTFTDLIRNQQRERLGVWRRVQALLGTSQNVSTMKTH